MFRFNKWERILSVCVPLYKEQVGQVRLSRLVNHLIRELLGEHLGELQQAGPALPQAPLLLSLLSPSLPPSRLLAIGPAGIVGQQFCGTESGAAAYKASTGL